MFREADTTLVGLCVGTTKISVIVAQRDLRMREKVQVIGIGTAPSDGIRKGLIVNLEQAVQSVRSAVYDAETIVGFDLKRAVVSFNAVDVKSISSNAMVSVGRNARPVPVQVDDVERIIENAQNGISYPNDKLALHAIPVRYYIDGTAVDAPLSMTGMVLQMDMHTVTVPLTHAQNVVNCVKRAGVDVEGLVIKPISSALGALMDEEMQVGAISICIGGGTTGVTLYKEGRPIKIGIIPIGGDHITNDLATVLRLPLKKAEEIKKRIFVSEDDHIAVTPRGQSERIISPNKVLEIISSRIEELFVDHVASIVSEHDVKLFPAGIILSGGVARTPGIDGLLSKVFKMPVRVADPQEYYQMPPGRDIASYVNAVGTIRYILNKERNPFSFIDAPKSVWDRGFAPIPRQSRETSEERRFSGGQSTTGQGIGDTVVNYTKNAWGKLKEVFKELF